MKDLLKGFILFLTISITGFSYADKPDTTNYDPFQLYKDAVFCTAIASEADTVESAVRYSLYLDAVKISGIYVLRIHERKFLELARKDLVKAKQKSYSMSSEERLAFFNNICEPVVKHYTLLFNKKARETDAMPVIKMYLDSLVIETVSESTQNYLINN